MRRLILPAEIREREFDARLLQGLLAAKRGWRSIVGSKALINRSIWRFPDGVYLCQTLTRRRISMLRLLRRLGVPSVGWCEEGLIYQSREVYLERRVAPGSLDELSALVAWGEQSRADLGSVVTEGQPQPVALGNPRFDLLRLGERGLYDEATARIEQRHGKFVLINTNFSNVNWAPESAARSRPSMGGKVGEAYEAFRDYRKELFDAFLDMVPRLAALLPDLRIVIRPHPAEDVAPWDACATELPNVVVEREGPVVPWLLAAAAVIHNGCTTAVETAVLGRAPIAYCPVVRKDLDAVLSNDISVAAHSPEELSESVALSAAGELKLGDEQNALFDRFVAGRRGPLATEAILDVFEQVERARERTGGRLAPRLFAMLRHGFKSVRPGHQTDRYIPTVFPPTSVGEVVERCAKLAACLDLDPAATRVEEISNNVFEMSPA